MKGLWKLRLLQAEEYGADGNAFSCTPHALTLRNTALGSGRKRQPAFSQEVVPDALVVLIVLQRSIMALMLSDGIKRTAWRVSMPPADLSYARH